MLFLWLHKQAILYGSGYLFGFAFLLQNEFRITTVFVDGIANIYIFFTSENKGNMKLHGYILNYPFVLSN